MKGRIPVKEGFLSFKTIETWIRYVCDSECEFAKQNIYVPFERGIVVGAMSIMNCSAAGFFTLNSFLCVSRMVHHPKDIQPI